MSAETIRNALAGLLEDSDNETAWNDVEEAVTGTDGAQVVRELEMARVAHERLRNWPVVARLLEYEVVLDEEPAIMAAKQVELARIYQEELLRDDLAMPAYRRALELKPEDAKLRAAIGEIEFGRANLEASVEQAMIEALDTEDDDIRVKMLLRAAEFTFRYGDKSPKSLATAKDYVSQALEHAPEHVEALQLAALIYGRLEHWSDLADVLTQRAEVAEGRLDKLAAAYQLALVTRHRLSDVERAVAAHERIFELEPSNGVAMQYLVAAYSQQEDWDRLVGVYEAHLEAGGLSKEGELGIVVQLAMMNWRSRGAPDAAEPYFERVRKADPAHAGMLQFFREHCQETGDSGRLMSILTDAQRAVSSNEQKAAFAEEIAHLAEGQDNSRRAIEQYKTVLRSDPDNAEAREHLKALYLETESYNALVELLRQDLQRVAEDDAPGQIAVLREIASIYRDRMQNETALLPVLTQIASLDETDIEAVRGMMAVYESLGRWRDLLLTQQRLAELTEDATEKVDLLRAVARRWLEQFSNVQNAIRAYEALLEATGDDPEAMEQLQELYKKRRVWDKLYELYEAQLTSIEDEGRIELMLEMAKLAAERLNKGDEAIRLLKEVLVFDPEHEGVLDQLERQAERQKDHDTVAFVLDKRIEAADDEKTKLSMLQKLGVLCADKLEDNERAQDAWRRVLELSPGHKRALRVLRQSFVDAGDWEGLENLYGSQEDYEGLADFLSTTADRSKDDEQRVELSFRAARVYEDMLSAPERAARSYERVLSIEEDNVRAARALLPIYQEEEKWSRLPGLYQILLDATEAVEEKIEILHKVAEISGGPLANKTAALGYARRAYELRPDDGGLEQLRDWSQQSGEWSAFIEVVKGRLDSDELDEDEARDFQLMLARVYAGEMSRIDEAVGIFRSLLEADPSDGDTARELEELLRAADRRDDLRWLFELKVGQEEGAERCTVLEEWATVEEEVFGEPDMAIELLRRVVAEDATRTTALAALTRLLLAGEDFAAAAAVMRTHRDAVEGQERVEIESALAELCFEHLEQPVEAFEACVRVLALTSDHSPVVALLEQLMDEPATRGRAAEALESIYADSGAAAKQADALRAMLEGVDEPARRLELCVRLAVVHETELDDAGAAFDVILAALVEAPDEIDLWDRSAELSVAAGRPTDLSEAYRKHLMAPAEGEEEEDAPSLTTELQVELCERAAVLHEEQLGDAEGAIPYLERMLVLDANSDTAFERLKSILNAVERWDDLEQLYQRRIEVTESDDTKVELLHQAALVAEDMVGDDQKAIRYFERIVEIDPLHIRATDALERLYGREERFVDLAALLERRLEVATDPEAAPIQQQLVDLYLHRLEKYDRVVPHLESVLRLRRDDLDVRALAEECLGVPELRQDAAALLDGLYEAVDDPRDLVRVLDVRLEGATEDEPRRELLHRIARLRDERLKDDAGAFEALRALMPLEPDDVAIRDRLLEVGRRLGEHAKMAESLVATAESASSPAARGAILMEAARLYRDRLDDIARAEAVYRQVLEIDAEDPDLVVPAAKALAVIYQEQQEHQKLADVLSNQVRLVQDDGERRDLHARIANIYEDLLENDEAAINAWQARLEEDAADAPALRALERLYERSEKWRALVDVMRSLEQAAEEPDERKRCMVKAAEVLAEELEEIDEAINAWRAVLDDFGHEPRILGALAGLYEKAEQWQDLAEIFDSWLALSDEVDERVRLFAGLGDARRLHLDDPHGALSSYREVLTLDPGHEGSRAALAAMLEHEDPEIKREAAEIIGPLYEADGDAERLLKVLDIEIESTYDPTAKLDTLERALATAEDTEGSSGRAFDYAARGVREAIGDPALGHWIETVERLATETKRHEDLLALFESVVVEILDAEVQQRTRLRAGEIARDELDDRERAIRHYTAALEAQADDQRPMVALEELYAAIGDNAKLLEILRLRAESADNDGDRVALLYRVAELQAGPLEVPADAIDTYEEIIDLALESRAIEALEGLYGGAERYDDLVSLYERQLDGLEGDETADIRVKIAEVAHGHLSDTPRALDELGEALRVDPDHAGSISALEKLLGSLEEPEYRGQVAELLEPVYLSSHDWSKLKGVLEARLETSVDPVDRGELLGRLATLYEEQLEDYGSALETAATRLRDEPGDEEIVAEVERLGRVLGEGSERKVAEIFAAALREVGADDPQTAALAARTGELFAVVGENEEALTWYRRSYEFSPDSSELFKAIDQLLVKLELSEERIEHYRAGLDHTFDDQARVRYLHTVAQLQRDLGRDEDAITTLCEVLDIEERNDLALDALTELYGKNERGDDLADLYERRADLADDAEAAAPYRLALAKVLAADESSRDRALDQLDMIVSDLPAHEGAIAEIERLLEDPEHKQRVIDLLRPIYRQAESWMGLIKLNEERLELAEDSLDKVDVLNDTAILWEDQLEQPEEAFAVMRQALELAPDSEEVRINLERLAENLGEWEALADSYDAAAAKIEDEFVKRQLLNGLANICDEQLDDPRRALGALRKVSALDPADDEALERMDTLCMLLSDWELMVTVLQQKADNATSDADRARLFGRLGGIKRDMLLDEDGAIEIYEQALDLSPESTRSLDHLIDLYEERDADRFVELLEQRIVLAEGGSDTRHDLVIKAADVYEKRLEKPDEAIRVLQLALDERPTDLDVLLRLERLFQTQEMFDELLENLKTQASVADEADKRHLLRNKIGDLYLSQFENAHDALEQYRLIIEENDQDSHAVAAVRKIGEQFEDLRLDVADLLEPVLNGAQQHEDLVAVMELRFSALTDPSDRAKTLNAMALIQEEQLDQPGAARDTLLRALTEIPDDAALHGDINRLCELTGEFDKYADALSERAAETYDAVIQTDLYARLGRIAEEHLEDRDRAIDAFSKAAEQAIEPAPLFEALDRLYLSAENWRELGRVLERRVELTEEPAAQADLYHRLGALQIQRFEDRDAGLATLRIAADLNPEHVGVREELEKLTDVEELFEEAAEALDTMYRVAQDSAARARLRNKRISYAPSTSERVRLRLELAQMLEDESFDTKSAQDVIQQALADEPSDPELLAQLERLATTNAAGNEGADAWRQAAAATGEAVAAGLKARDEGAAEGTVTSEQARDLLLRSAAWYREHCQDDEAAEKRLEEALAQDDSCVPAVLALEEIHRAAGREKDLVATLRKLAELAQAGGDVDRAPAELRREAKVLAETTLEDADLAEQILRDMLTADDADAWALAELCTVCERNEDYKELYTLLMRRMELMPEPDVLRELRHQAASVAADRLDDREGAIDLYEQAFEDDPHDQVASQALRELYEKLQRFEDMLRFTERLIDLSDDTEAKAELRLESARICIDILGAPTEGIEHLNAVLDEVPSHQGAVEQLAKLLEKEERDDELADLLTKQIDLAREAGETKKELGYRVKLSELYETRLNDRDKAIEGYNAVLEADSSFRPALEALARLYEQQDQAENAAKTYEKLLDGAEAQDLTRLALKARDLFVAVKEQEAASRVLEAVLERGDALSADAIQQLRDGLRTLYREREAWQELADLYKLEASEAEGDDEKVVLYRKAADIHAKERSDHAAAAELLEKALELKSEDRDLMLALCDEYTGSGRGKAAIDVLNRVVESYGGRRSKDLADIHQRISAAYLAEGDQVAALGELESARKMDPGSVVILHELGTLSLKLAGDTSGADAEEHVKRAGNAFRSLLLQRLDADAPVTKAEVFYHLALVSQAEGDKKKAKQMAERALSNDKNLAKAKDLLDELGS